MYVSYGIFNFTKQKVCHLPAIYWANNVGRLPSLEANLNQICPNGWSAIGEWLIRTTVKLTLARVKFSSQENWPIESNTRRALPRFHLFNIGGHILHLRDADRRAKNGDWVRAEYDTKVSLISRPVLFLRARNKHDSYEIFDR